MAISDRKPRRARSLPFCVAALVLFGLCLLLMWPGLAAYDTIKQYEQAISGHYDDWHPPIMARLWALMLAAGGRGTAPMLVLQLGLYWIGFGLFAGALARIGAPRVAAATLLVALSPIVANWLPVIVKDTQMIAALVAATGIVAWHRLGDGHLRQAAPLPEREGSGVGSPADRATPAPCEPTPSPSLSGRGETGLPSLSGRGGAGGRMPWWAAALAGLLLAYAALVRANAVFAVVPFALMLGGWGGVRRWWTRALLLAIATLLVIGISDPINHRLFDAERSGVSGTLPLFDLVGIAHDAPLAAPPGLTPPEWAQAEKLGCYTPFYWDPFGDATRCGGMGDAILDEDDGAPPIMRTWIATIAAHPLAYAEHRLAHLDATLRIATPADEKSAAAPFRSDANPYALGGPATSLTATLKTVADAIERTPLGVPAVWLVFLCGIGWTLLGTAPQPARDLGLALAFSGMTMTASFAVVSIASDLRYHLWLIVASGLAVLALAGCRGIARRRLGWTLGVTLLAVVASALARAHGIALRY